MNFRCRWFDHFLLYILAIFQFISVLKFTKSFCRAFYSWFCCIYSASKLSMFFCISFMSSLNSLKAFTGLAVGVASFSFACFFREEIVGYFDYSFIFSSFVDFCSVLNFFWSKFIRFCVLASSTSSSTTFLFLFYSYCSIAPISFLSFYWSIRAELSAKRSLFMCACFSDYDRSNIDFFYLCWPSNLLN